MALWRLLGDDTVINWLHRGQRLLSEQLLLHKACIICSQRVIMKGKKKHLFTRDSVGSFQLWINFMPCMPLMCRPSANFVLNRRKQLSQVVEMWIQRVIFYLGYASHLNTGSMYPFFGGCGILLMLLIWQIHCIFKDVTPLFQTLSSELAFQLYH